MTKMTEKKANTIFQLINWKVGIMSGGIEGSKILININVLDNNRAEVTWRNPEIAGYSGEYHYADTSPHTDIYEISGEKVSVNGKDPFAILSDGIMTPEEVEKWFYAEIRSS